MRDRRQYFRFDSQRSGNFPFVDAKANALAVDRWPVQIHPPLSCDNATKGNQRFLCLPTVFGERAARNGRLSSPT